MVWHSGAGILLVVPVSQAMKAELRMDCEAPLQQLPLHPRATPCVPQIQCCSLNGSRLLRLRLPIKCCSNGDGLLLRATIRNGSLS